MKYDITPFINNMRGMSKSITKALCMHAPELAAVTGTVGFITSLGVMYVQAPKIQKDIEDKNWKQAAIDASPVALTATLSTVAVIGGMKESQKRYAAMTAAYTLTDAALIDRKNAELTSLSKKKVEEIDQKEAENAVANNPPVMEEVSQIGVGTCLHYDSMMKRYFRADVEAVNKSLQDIRTRAGKGYTMTVGDFYTNLGANEVFQRVYIDDKLYEHLGWLMPEYRDTQCEASDSELPDADFQTITIPGVEPIRVLKWLNVQYIHDMSYSIRID